MKRTITIPLLALLIWCLIIAATEGWRAYQENHPPEPSELTIYYDSRDLVEAFAIEGIKPEVGVNIEITEATIDESELQLRVLGYNYARRGETNHQDITLQQLIEQLNLSNLKAQFNPEDRSALVQDFINWYKAVNNRPETMDPYRKELLVIYNRYIYDHDHREFEGIKLSNLTPDQINELAKKERDSSYDLNLGNPP